MSKPAHFLLTIEIGCQQKVDVEGMLKVVNGLLGNKAMFKFRVVGEPKILACMTTNEFLNILKKEATTALTVRGTGQELELFKVFGQRKVIGLICQDSPGDFEKLMQNLPFVKKMFDRCNNKPDG